MNEADAEKQDWAKFIKEFFRGILKLLPFIEKISRKKESEKYSFSKLCIIVFGLLSFFIYVLFNSFRSFDFSSTFLLVIFISFGMTIFSPFMTLRLKMKEG
jgi:hypothetical protein